MSQNSDEKRKIMDDIEKTGFPLEMTVTSALESKNWIVNNQEGYTDPDEQKMRTIDVMGFKRMDLPEESIYQRLHVAIVIECKKSNKPWVFWTRKKSQITSFESVIAYGIIKHAAKPALHPLQLEKLSSLHHYYSTCESVGMISFEPYTNGEGARIFEATLQVTKALHSELKQIKEFLRTEVKGKTDLFHLAYPVIVFDGQLYELANNKEELALSRVDYVQYLVHRISPNVDESFVIDIITKEFLSKYMDIVEKEIDLWKENISSLTSPSLSPSS